MSKRNTSKILIIVPHGVRIQFIRKKKSINGNIKLIKDFILNKKRVRCLAPLYIMISVHMAEERKML